MATEPDAAGLFRLLSWLSPSFPVGAYTYSHGLEWALDSGEVQGLEGVRAWLRGVLRHGSGRSDAILAAHAWRVADAQALQPLLELASALAPSRERRLETSAQGRAFLDAVRGAWPTSRLGWFDGVPPARLAYPAVVGVAAAGHGIPLAPLLHGYLHAFVANLVSAAVRLVPLGQTDGQRLVAGFEADIDAVAESAQQASLEELGGCSLLADIASMRHETQYSRLFRS